MTINQRRIINALRKTARALSAAYNCDVSVAYNVDPDADQSETLIVRAGGETTSCPVLNDIYRGIVHETDQEESVFLLFLTSAAGASDALKKAQSRARSGRPAPATHTPPLTIVATSDVQ